MVDDIVERDVSKTNKNTQEFAQDSPITCD